MYYAINATLYNRWYLIQYTINPGQNLEPSVTQLCPVMLYVSLSQLVTNFLMDVLEVYWLLCKEFWCLARFPLLENCLPHCPQGYLTPSCTRLRCSAILPFVVALMVALPARVFDSFMYCPFVLSKTSLCSCLMVALPTRVLDSFMYCPFVFSQMWLWS